MNFNGYYEKIGTIDKDILQQAEKNISEFEELKAYNFKHGEWLRLDSYRNPDNHLLENIIGSELVDIVKAMFPEDEHFGWSVSHMPGNSTVVDHADRMFFHRIAKRIIVCVSDVPDVLNWHWSSDRHTNIPYVFEYGNVYRLNTAITHGVKNNNANHRRAVYFDMMPKRLYNKFNCHADILKVILADAVGEKYVL